MSAGLLSAPGTRFGPCEACSHRDCANTREIAARLCDICGEAIGYDRRFYNVEGKLVHADEYEEKAEKEKDAKGSGSHDQTQP